MSLDFSNRDPKDPNGIVSLDTSTAQEAWVKDNDWSTVYYSLPEARKAGANNKVKVATAITNEGKKYNVVIGADGAPISQVGDSTGQDDDQANRWKNQQNTQAPPGGITTRTINGQVFQWNPQTRAYDIPTGQPPVTTGTAANPQATNPSERYEVRNDGPNGAPRLIRVEERRDAQGNVVPTYTEVTPDKWPVTGTTETVKNGRKIKVTHFGYGLPDREDDLGEDTSKKGTTTLREDGSGNLVAVTTYPDGRPPATAPVPGVVGKPQQVTVDGTVYERGADGTYKPAAGLPTPGAGVKNVDPFVPDYTQPDLGLSAWAGRQAQKIGKPSAAGGITQQEYDSAVKAAHDQASVTVSNISSMTAAQRQQFIDQETAKNKARDYVEGDINRDNGIFTKMLGWTDPKSDAIMGFYSSPQRAAAQRDWAAEHADQPPALHPMFTSLAQRAGAAPVQSGPPLTTDPAGAAMREAQNQQNQAQSNAAFQQAQSGGGGAPAVAAPSAIQPAPVTAGASAAPAASTAGPPLGQGQDASTLPQRAGGNEAPDDILTVQHPDGSFIYMTRTNWDASDPTFRQSARVVNAENGAAFRSQHPITNEAPSYAKPAGDIPYANPEGGDVPGYRPNLGQPGEPAISPEVQYGGGGDSQSMLPQQPGPVSAWAAKWAGSPAMGQPSAPTNEGPAAIQNPALANLAQQPQQFDPYDTAASLVGLGVPVDAVREAMRQMGHLG